MKFWTEVRRRVLTKEISKRAARKEYGLGWATLEKILAYDEPPGYRQSVPRRKRKLEPFLPIIYQILEDDRQAPRKQRHTAHRIFERLRDEHAPQAARRSSRTLSESGSSLARKSFCRCRIHQVKRKSTSAKRRSSSMAWRRR